MERQDFDFWTKQINAAKEEHHDWFDQCKKLEDKFIDKEVPINLFYSNVQILSAALLNNEPKPEVTRRFFNATTADKKKSDLYTTTARIAQSGIEYYFTKNSAIDVAKAAVKGAIKCGRGVLWVDYEPTIVQTTPDMGLIKRMAVKAGLAAAPEPEEYVAERNIKIVSLSPEEYLCSYAENPHNIWWKARRHLMNRDALQSRFGYVATDAELKYSSTDTNVQTQEKLGEVWEIWDKNNKQRLFLLLGGKSNDFLQAPQTDPYKLTDFFPCWDYTPLTKSRSVVPTPEYMIYGKLLEEINLLSEKNAALGKKVKYVTICHNKDQELVQQLTSASDGSVVASTAHVDDIRNVVTTLDISGAQGMIEKNNARIEILKNQLYEITGMSDLMRGASDPRETATAQRIKGLFGGLRFRDRQISVQEGIKNIFRIVAELICEHWDWDTLSNISGVELLSATEKQVYGQQVVANQQAAQTGVPAPYKMDAFIVKQLEKPTSDEVLHVLRDDRMRNFVIDIESTATDFDNKAEQLTTIQKMTEIFNGITQSAQFVSNPEFVESYVALVKMQLAHVKCSSAVANQFTDGLIQFANKIRQSQKQAPQPTIEDKKLQLDSQKATADNQVAMAKIAADKEIKMQQLHQDAAFKERELLLREREVAVKEREIYAESQANAVRIANGIAPDTNLG